MFVFAERVFAERCVRGRVRSCVQALFPGFSLCSGRGATFLCSAVFAVFGVFAGGFTVVFAVFGPSCKYICVLCSVFGVLLRFDSKDATNPYSPKCGHFVSHLFRTWASTPDIFR